MSKPRLVEVTSPREYTDLIAGRDDIGVPRITESGDGRVWADAEELRQWRAGRTQAQSSESQQ